MDDVLHKIPDLKNIFSFVFTGEDTLKTEEYIVKDLSPLLFSRDTNDIIIIDTDPTRIDEDVFSSIIL